MREFKQRVIDRYTEEAPNHYIAGLGADIIKRVPNRVLLKGNFEAKIGRIFRRMTISHYFIKGTYKATTKESIYYFLQSIYEVIRNERKRIS